MNEPRELLPQWVKSYAKEARKNAAAYRTKGPPCNGRPTWAAFQAAAAAWDASAEAWETVLADGERW